MALERDEAAELISELTEAVASEAVLEAVAVESVALPAASLEKMVVLPMVLVIVLSSEVMVETISEVVIAPACTC